MRARRAAASLPRVQLQRLYPRSGETSPEALIAGLDLGSRAPAARPYVVLNMVTSIDGRAALAGGTRGLGGEADRLIFHHLRTQADAVLVGAGTATAERYGAPIKNGELRAKREAEGLEPDPLTVIVSGRLNLPVDLPILADPGARVIVATAAEHDLDGVAAPVEYMRTGDDLALLLARLRDEHGVRSVLCEGGPTLNSHLLAAGAIDELFHCTSPQVVGGGDEPTMVEGRALPDPARGELVWLCEAEGDLFARWRLRG